MTRYHFEDFTLDAADRRLLRDGTALELNARYFDALALLVSEPGRLVSKDAFLEQVWRGVPVTDEALTQCIKTLRRTLGDEATRPRFIETVPKHGYRFIAAVDSGAPARPAQPHPAADFSPALWGTIGGATAGAIGGLIYGFAAASQPLGPGMGATSVLLVLLCATLLVALVGGAAVSLGITLATSRAPGTQWQWSVAGGAAGGLLVGAIVKLLGLDAFNLLVGQSPGDITGAAEGALLGAAVGMAAWLSQRGANAGSLRYSLAIAALAGAAAGALVPLLDGRLFGGSLDLLIRAFPHSQLSLSPVGALFGEAAFGPRTQVITAALEGALFAAGVVGGMAFSRRQA